MRNLQVGVIDAGDGSPHPLADAVTHQQGIATQRLSSASNNLNGIDAVVVDVPLERRFEVISRLQDGFDGPVLSQMPVGRDAAECAALASQSAKAPLVSLNPLCYDTSLARLLAEVHQSPDQLQTLFASWRFKARSTMVQELAQLIDYVGVLAGGPPEHLSRLHRASPWLLLAIVGYADGLIATIEVGDLLPESNARTSEFLIECFDRNRAYHCQPDAQRVTLERGTTSFVPWWPDPFSTMLTEFFSQLTTEDQKLTRGPMHDHAVLSTCETLTAPS